MSGWLKLWRKAMHSEQWKDPFLWHLFCYCLMKSAYEKSSVLVEIGPGTKVVEVDRGQFIWGRRAALRALPNWGNDPKKPERYLKKLEQLKAISRIVVPHQFTIVTIVEWDTYQAEAEGRDLPPALPPAPPIGPRCDQPIGPAGGHKEEGKTFKKSKKPRKGAGRPDTVEQVQAYIDENQYPVDAQRWWDHYESNGWKVGRNSMKNWQATVRKWLPEGWKRPESKPQADRYYLSTTGKWVDSHTGEEYDKCPA